MKLLSLLLAVALSLSSLAQTNAPYNFKAIEVVNNQLHAIAINSGNGMGLYKYANHNWTFLQTVYAKKIVQNAQNKIIVLTDNHSAFELSGNTWVHIPGTLRDLTYNSFDKKNYGLMGNSLFQYNSLKRAWALAEMPGLDFAQAIRFDRQGVLHILDKAHNVFRFNQDSTWTAVAEGGIDDFFFDKNNRLIVQKGTEWFHAQDGNFTSELKNASQTAYIDRYIKFSVDAAGMLYQHNGSNVTAISGQKLPLFNGVLVDYGTDMTTVDTLTGEAKFFEAVRNNDLAGMQYLMRFNPNLSLTNKNSENVLFIAINNQNYEMADFLLKSGVNKDQTNNQGKTALDMACDLDDTRFIGLLLGYGANPRVGNPFNTFLNRSIADKNDDYKTALQLIQSGAKTTVHYLTRSSMENFTGISKALIEASTVNFDYNKLLLDAVKNYNGELATLALEKGAKPQQALELGITLKDIPLILASINKGAEPDLAIDFAIETGQQEILKQALTRNPKLAPTVMLKAANQGSQDFMLLAQTHGADLNTAFPIVVKNKDTASVDFLVQNGANASHGLETSVKEQDLFFTEKLFQLGALADSSKYLKIAVNNSQLEMVDLLCRNGADANHGMIPAIKKGDGPAVDMLLNYGANVSNPKFIRVATRRGEIAIVEVLFTTGAPTDSLVTIGVLANQLKCVTFFIENGLSIVSATDMPNGVETGNLEMVKFLINNGGNASDGIAKSIEINNQPIFDFLMTQNPSVTDGELLYIAVKNNNAHIATVLASKGCPMNYNDNKGNNLLHIAAMNQSYAIANMIINKKAVDINKVNNAGDQPLHYVVTKGKNLELCQLYVENNADINARNGQGKLVYKVARGVKVKKYLKKQGAQKK